MFEHFESFSNASGLAALPPGHLHTQDIYFALFSLSPNVFQTCFLTMDTPISASSLSDNSTSCDHC